MNNGTKIRTVLRVAMSLYTGFMIWQATVASMGYKWLTIVWALLTIAAGWTVDVLTTYFNQDYSKEAAIGTGITRQLKRQKEPGYTGDILFPEPEDLPDPEDEEALEDMDNE